MPVSYSKPTNFPYLNVSRYSVASWYKNNDYETNDNLVSSVGIQVHSIAMHFLICIAKSANEKIDTELRPG